MTETTFSRCPLRVVIFGGSACEPDSTRWSDAHALGRACAEQGWIIINGGYGGTMEASARGAREAGGTVIGVACAIFHSPPNQFLSEVVMTNDLHHRLRGLIELGQAFICLPGSTGTLAELALVWEMMNKRLMPVGPRLCFGDFWKPIVSIFDDDPNADPRVPALEGLRERRGELVAFVDTPAAAVDQIRRQTGWA
jgi:uncharacterized protein (TIGR00730 family)